MESFQAYQTFLALKRHFTPGSGYDFHKYNGKIRASVKSFESHAYSYQKLVKRRDPFGLMVANVSHNPKCWIGDLFTPESEERYVHWSKVTESIGYFIKQMAQFDDFDEALQFHDGGHPPALLAVMDGTLDIEVLAVIDEMCMFTKHWLAVSGWDPTVKDVSFRIKALHGFIAFEKETVKKELKKIFEARTEVDRVA